MKFSGDSSVQLPHSHVEWLQSGTDMCTLDTVYHVSGHIPTVTDRNIGIVVW
jgi:hypothetical protein